MGPTRQGHGVWVSVLVSMKYICDAPGKKTWFRIETEAEAEADTETGEKDPLLEEKKCFENDRDAAEKCVEALAKARDAEHATNQ